MRSRAIADDRHEQHGARPSWTAKGEQSYIRRELIFTQQVVCFMPRKRKKKTFTAGGEARRLARERAGSPPAGRILPDKRRKPPKHKTKLIESELL
ncbi:MAG TPA: hypothetical protein VEU31_09670 [Candidatus Acidoferrales bacterium]|nr:hypothetical protein [Candidatus Acidoferrales bacterium]